MIHTPEGYKEQAEAQRAAPGYKEYDSAHSKALSQQIRSSIAEDLIADQASYEFHKKQAKN